MTVTPSRTSSKVNWPVFIASALIIVVFTTWAALDSDTASSVLETTFGWLGHNLGWYFILTAAIIVIFVLIIAFSRLGKTRLGPDHSTPKFSLFTWASMLFAAGIGVDLMFFAVIGPATNLRVGPGAAEGTLQAAEQAALWTMFHYGIPGWAMYALTGMAFGLFAYRYHLPLSIRSALYPIIGKRAQGRAGDAVEVGAVIGTVFGIATSLGIGVVFLSYGISWLFGVESGPAVQISLIVLAAIVVTISTYSGVDKGIRRLSELNVLVAILLMVYVLVSGETVRLLNALVKNIGDFFVMLPGALVQTFAYDTDPAWLEEDWVMWWTVFFWTWWMAWSIFVGLFLARISRGRTLRQFIIGVLLVPFLFNALWISIFGNATIFRIMGGDTSFAEAAEDPDGAGYFALMAEFPGATFIIGVSVLVGLLFYVTSADSGSLVLANFTSRVSVENSDGPRWLRVVWSVIIGALTIVMLMLEGIFTLQMAAVIIGLPLSIVLYMLLVSVWRALRMENYSTDSRSASLPSMLSERSQETTPESWRRRLARHMHYPSETETVEYMDTVAVPAVEEVAEELRKRGAEVTCTRGVVEGTEIPQVDLHVYFGDQPMFKYQPYAVQYPVPTFVLKTRRSGEVFQKVEVFSATGSTGYDILGYTKEQVIADILDAYERHLSMLQLSDQSGHAPVAIDTGSIPNDWDHVRAEKKAE
ncbi:choline BCCT transporter BetT [Nesterenkonia muleiensis]|uniref:choline BCCT transporter BetT n=1 Tax=Nesterenkonia muleiensis TaxID=2282648 RepID=UPI001EE4D386|nr:choline BCCT transporter BetT [Nesterenkonia muleiensis]